MALRAPTALAVLLLAASIATTAAAQDAARSDDEARSLFAAGEIAYGDGRYDSALDSFVRAYELSHRVELLYNIGLTAEHLRHDEQALHAYEGYLEGRPESEHRSAIEARIHILREAIASQTPVTTATTDATPAPMPTPAPPPPPPSSGPDTGALVLTIAGGVIALGGVALLIVAAIDTSTVQGATYPSHWSDVQSAYDLAFPLSVAGAVALGVGAAAAIGGGIWIGLGGSGAHAEVAFTPSGLSFRGSF